MIPSKLATNSKCAGSFSRLWHCVSERNPRSYAKLHDFDHSLVLAVFCVLELANEAMRECALSNVGMSVASCNDHDRKWSYDHLLSLWAVIAAASVRFHIRLVACGMNAFLGQADHAFGDLRAMVSFAWCLPYRSDGFVYAHLQLEHG